MHSRLFLTRLICLWNVKATYRWPLVDARPYSARITISASSSTFRRAFRREINYWTEEEDEILAQGIAEGLRYPEIAQKLPGRSADACRVRTYRIHPSAIKRRNEWTPEEVEILAQGREEGLPYAAIAQKLPLRTERTCQSYASMYRLVPSPKWTKEEVNILAQGVKEGLKYSAIAQKLPGRSIYACAKHAFRQNLLPKRKRNPRCTPEDASTDSDAS